ncbi:MAG: glycosyltransferase family 4 protein [Kofleriaceae bacterium]
MKTCSAFSRLGHEVVLVAKDGGSTSDAHAVYCVPPTFEIDRVGRPSRRGGGLFYAAGMGHRLLSRRRWADLVYCRDPIGAVIATQLRLPTVFEAHEVPEARWLQSVLRRALGRCVATVAITHALERDLRATDIQPVDRPVIVSPDACDPPRDPPRKRPPGSPPTVGYVGSLYPGRGIETILGLAEAMPDLRFSVVGGSEDDLARLRPQAPANVTLHGFRMQAELPGFYETFDVVVMPHSLRGVAGATKTSDISKWTSPMKMFEYMASGVPLVASRLPVLQEVLRDGENAIIAADESIATWGAAIRRLLADDELRFRLAHRAHVELIERYTWDARAREIMTSLDKLRAHL